MRIVFVPSNNQDNLYRYDAYAFGLLGGISYGKITTSIYLKVSVSDFLTLFSARAGGDWFFMVKPAPILLGGDIRNVSPSKWTTQRTT